MQGLDHGHFPTQLIELVGRRYEFLAVLDTHAYDKRTLETKLDVSRSTVDRALRDLETSTLVDRTADGYRTTLYGSTLLAIYDALLDYVDNVQRAQSLLAELPPDTEFSIGLIMDAEIVVAEEPVRHAPASRIADLVKAATALRGLAYAHTSPEAVDLFQQQVLEEEMSMEIVFRQQMYENFKSAYPTVVDSLHAASNYTAAVIPDLPFGLFILTIDATEHVCLIVYDTDYTLNGIIINDTPDAVAWGTRLFEQYQAQATPVPEE